MFGPAAGRDIFVSNTSGDDHCTGQLARNVAGNGPVRDHHQGPATGLGGDRIVLAAGGPPYGE